MRSQEPGNTRFKPPEKREAAVVRTCVITGFGINADDELKRAFELAGSKAEKIHINDLIHAPRLFESFHILAFPGGFSFGDHLGSGKVFAGLFKSTLGQALDEFVTSGKLVIGICNGFQVLVKMGILPNLSGGWNPEVSLIHNDSGKFEDRWVKVRFNPSSPCVWTQGLDKMELPVRHGEGKLVTSSQTILNTLFSEGLVALRYVSRSPERKRVEYPDNPNGSERDVAGICDRTGRILGLMPHPEAFVYPENHPRWTREAIQEGWGLRLFERGVRFMENRLRG
jgi:phosphoribosylformylglycinamidine synthase I